MASKFEDSVNEALANILTITSNGTSSGLDGTTRGLELLLNGVASTAASTERGLRWLFNDFPTESWDKLKEKDKNPAVKFFADEIIAERDRLVTSATSKDYIDDVDKIYTRAMKAMGLVNRKAYQAAISLGPMIMSAHNTGDPVDRSNKNINTTLEDFEKKISAIMENQRFSLEHRPSDGKRDYSHLVCFSPNMVADKLLEVTQANVQKILVQKGEDASYKRAKMLRT